MRVNDYLRKGDPIGYVSDLSNTPIGWSNKIALVVMIDGPGHYSPCLLNPDLSYCNLCHPGSIERNNIDNYKEICGFN